jgi:hypothetical protein
LFAIKEDLKVEDELLKVSCGLRFGVTPSRATYLVDDFSNAALNGSWSFFGEPQHPISILKGLQESLTQTEFIFAEGCNLY